MRTVRPVSDHRQWVEQQPLGNYCSSCGAYWTCEHRTGWQPRTEEIPSPREFGEMEDAARVLRREHPDAEIVIRRCHLCGKWSACVGIVCPDCLDAAHSLTYEDLLRAQGMLR